MRAFINYLLIVLLVTEFFSCRKAYNPPITTHDYAYLVVEGVINSGNDTTSITLNRTVQIGAATTHRPESGAKVLIESDQNTKYQLTERDSGRYFIANLNLPTTGKYRLHIFTSSGKEYESDFVENKISPPIDTITHSFTSHSVQFYVSAHDPTKSTRYYRWEYHEYWSYDSKFTTVLQYKDSAIIGLPVDSDYNHCYRNASPANGIYISTSEKLSEDIVNNVPVTVVEGLSGKLVREYAVEIRQFAITKEAYIYWQQLKLNTEQLGSIFDKQPTASPTNIHCITNPSEPVVGYVSVSTNTLKRAFITQADVPFRVVTLPGEMPPPGSYLDTLSCPTSHLLFDPLPTLPGRLYQTFSSGQYMPYAFYYNPPTVIVGYNYAPCECVDCRKLGGTNKKPSWWPWQY